ncbi:mitochondrial ribosomal subunit protein-domain-containing protein [Xylaria bambusicola]|uniref:mitochondrial ribosomal subunit protein-domain-containing protein n=1 Tax=Xylaria bambusicola TaxID=326684 RepID=UPI00200736B0|nr:mitochondrial ribosomal subunit protein-domain-containing protein [Xylaria bambusicola]KAI0521800.1 mitochondrial ribosomal subunit protein-domain-containing protein [Xylaria bambusicola]
MASAVQSVRLCLRAARRRAAAPATATPRRQYLAVRTFSSTPFQRQPATRKDEDDINELEREIQEIDEADEIDPVEYERALSELARDRGFQNATTAAERAANNMGEVMTEAMRLPRLQGKLFWAEEEPDQDLIDDELDVDKFDEDDIMAMAHGKFEEFREYREYARIAAWQMPLLSKLATPFEPPTAQEPLRFRYTSYMGEFHPAEKKVVVEFSPRDMPLTEAQQQKLRKLLGPRLNPETDIAKMSCEQFEHQAQNKRYLGDVVNKLVAQAKDPTDMFEDVPLDTRHHTFKVKPKFPKEWRLTEERRQFLEESRQQALLLDQKKEEEGTLVNGAERIEEVYNPPKTEKIPEMAETANARLRSFLSPPPLRRHQHPPLGR